MSIQINNNSVIRLIVRRGPNSDRQLSTLAQGELGYTTDTQRLFIGNGQLGTEVVAGNVFLGFVNGVNNIGTAQVGDFAFDTSVGALFAYTTTGWSSVAPASGVNVEYANGLRVSASIAGTGLNLNYSGTGQLQFDSNYLTLSNTTSSLYIGSTPANAATQSTSRLVTQGSVAVLDPSGTNAIVLSAFGAGSTITLGGSGTLSSSNPLTLTVGTPYSFTCKPGLASSSSFAALTASPSFEFTGGLVKINSSLYVTGSSYAAYTISNVSTTTTVSATSAFIIDVTGNSVTPLTALQVLDGHAIAGQMLLNVGKAGSTVLNASNYPNNFVGINTTNSYNNNATLSVSGNSYFVGNTFNVNCSSSGSISLTGNTTIQGYLSTTGDIIAFSSSDERLKDDVTVLTGALDKILKLRGVEFNWNDKATRTGHDVGVIAQEVQQQLPEAVNARSDGYLAVDYNKIIPLLIEAIKELNSKIK